MAAAKTRGKTLDEYIAGGATRWLHIHEEMAFDALQAMQEFVEMREAQQPAEGGPTEEKPSGRRAKAAR